MKAFLLNSISSHLMALYSHPTASVLVNGSASTPFVISNGIRQGCPLSPLLFVLVMEHLATAIRQNNNIMGIPTPSSEVKLSLYADDLLVYIQQPHTFLPSLMQELRRFGDLSNFKLNMSKTEALNISLTPSTLTQLRTNFPFQWGARGISYLGVTIPSNLADLYNLNFPPLLSRIRKELDTWNQTPLPWFGRINTLKMDTLPKLLYVFQTIPILLPQRFFASLRSMSIRFVWQQGMSRIRHALLTYPKTRGGVGLPDFEMYHRAAVLSRILEWLPRPFPKASTAIEQDLSTSDLRALLWGYGRGLSTLANCSPLTTAALHLWYRKGLLPILSTDPSLLTSLFDHPDLPQGMSTNLVGPYSRDAWPTANSFIHPNTGTPVLPGARGNWLTALRISSFCSDLFSSTHTHRPLTDYEQLCSLSETPRHLLSTIYKLLHSLTHDQLPPYTRRWATDLGKDLSPDDWQKSFHFTHKSSISCHIQEKNFKLLARWYRDPQSLHKIFPSTATTCWRSRGQLSPHMVELQRHPAIMVTGFCHIQ